MRTTRAQFEAFKRAFTKWQMKFGLTQFRVTFEHGYVEGGWAEIAVDQLGGVASVTFAAEIEDHIEEPPDPAAIGLHEAIELLLSPLRWLAQCRYVMPDEIALETHRIVRRLENILE